MKILTAAVVIASLTLLSCPAAAQHRPQMWYQNREIPMNCEQIEHGMEVALGTAQALGRMMTEKNCSDGSGSCVAETHLAGEALKMFNFLAEMREWECSDA